MKAHRTFSLASDVSWTKFGDFKNSLHAYNVVHKFKNGQGGHFFQWRERKAASSRRTPKL